MLFDSSTIIFGISICTTARGWIVSCLPIIVTSTISGTGRSPCSATVLEVVCASFTISNTHFGPQPRTLFDEALSTGSLMCGVREHCSFQHGVPHGWQALRTKKATTENLGKKRLMQGRGLKIQRPPIPPRPLKTFQSRSPTIYPPLRIIGFIHVLHLLSIIIIGLLLLMFEDSLVAHRDDFGKSPKNTKKMF